MAKGVDYSWSRPSPEALKKAGIKFVCRYLSYRTDGKNLTLAEAKKLNAVGISVVSNWENSAGDMLGGYSAGMEHAKEADRQHRACGGPSGKPIYFSVDFDATPAQLTTCYAYLKGVASVIGWDRIGVYGGYKAIAYMHAKGIKYLWQTYAWSGGKWHPNAMIQQYKNNVSFAGGYVDHNRSMTADFGQWKVGDNVGLLDKLKLSKFAVSKWKIGGTINTNTALAEMYVYTRNASDNTRKLIEELGKLKTQVAKLQAQVDKLEGR